MIKIGSFGITIQKEINSTPASWVNPGPYQRFCITSSVNAHLARANVDQYAANPDFAAGQTDFYLLSGLPVEVILLPGEVLSWVVDSADIDGTLWLTPASQTN